MTLSTLFTVLLYFAGLAAVIVGLRSMRPRHLRIDVGQTSELRRSARVARINDFRKPAVPARGLRTRDRKRHVLDEPRPLPMWEPPDPGPKAA